jgi:DNA-directed RNA polymerase specialized sigma24 family protein
MSFDDIDLFIRMDELGKLRGFIMTMRPKQQELIDMVYYQKRKITHIARDLGISRRAVYYRLDTIKKKLVKLLEGGTHGKAHKKTNR